jgi:hypothetical protein
MEAVPGSADAAGNGAMPGSSFEEPALGTARGAARGVKW